MKILLVDVQKPNTGLCLEHWFDSNSEKFLCPSLALPTLAAYSSNNEVEIIDEKIDKLTDYDADLVGMSFKSLSLNRAKEIVLEFKKRGKKVIAGGIHASLDFQEVSKFVDAVVIGEGESVWPQVIEDTANNKLKTIYRAPNLIDMATIPVPRFDLLNNHLYSYHSVQTSRGCSLNCEFCPTKMLFGGIFRSKPVENVIAEIRTCLDIEEKNFFFVDDIFGAGDKKYLSQLLPQIEKLDIRFAIISDFLVLDSELVMQLSRAGCQTICLNMPGSCSLEEAIAIQGIQALGIDVWGYFMFGFEPHTPDVFQKVVDFVRLTDMRAVSLTVMAPFPNTPMYKKLTEEDRIVNSDWNIYDQNHAVHIPTNMTYEELNQGYDYILEELSDKVGFGNYSKLSQKEVSANV